jgi:hypothetical protein
MKSAILFRVVAFVFLLFTAGHTFGFLTFKSPTPEGVAVMDAMNRVQFSIGANQTSSYGNFYRGFGLSISAAQLFSAFLAWQLGAMAKRGSKEVKTLGWGLFVWQLPGLVLSFLYFGVPPMVLGLVVTILIGWATAAAKVS